MRFYHGTSASKARKIETEGFAPGDANWEVGSREGFVYMSRAYAPFFAEHSKAENNELALVLCEVEPDDLDPDDDWLMAALGSNVYTEAELNEIDPETYRDQWIASLDQLGSVSARPDKVKVIGVTYFNGSGLVRLSDPTITVINYKIMGGYYHWLSDEIYSGKPLEKIAEEVLPKILKGKIADHTPKWMTLSDYKGGCYETVNQS